MSPPVKRSDMILSWPFVVTLFLGIIIWGSIIVDDISHSYLVDAVSFVAFVALIVTLPVTMTGGISQYGLLSLSWLPGPVLCVGILLSIFVFVGEVNYSIYNWRFKQQVEQYTRTVDDIKNGVVSTGKNVDLINTDQIKDVSPDVLQVWAAHCNHGTVVVKFLVSRNFGRVRRGYLFDDCDDPAISIARGNAGQSISLDRIQGPWYEFED